MASATLTASGWFRTLSPDSKFRFRTWFRPPRKNRPTTRLRWRSSPSRSTTSGNDVDAFFCVDQRSKEVRDKFDYFLFLSSKKTFTSFNFFIPSNHKSKKNSIPRFCLRLLLNVKLFVLNVALDFLCRHRRRRRRSRRLSTHDCFLAWQKSTLVVVVAGAAFFARWAQPRDDKNEAFFSILEVKVNEVQLYLWLLIAIIILGTFLIWHELTFLLENISAH